MVLVQTGKHRIKRLQTARMSWHQMQVLVVELDRQGMAPQAEAVWAHKDSVTGATGHNCGERAKLEAAKKGALLGIALAT